MYSTLIIAHSAFRWAVFISLIYSIIISWRGYVSKSGFSKSNNTIRHWTATIAHIQLMLGIVLYTQSPVVKFYFSDYPGNEGEPFFFGITHIILMLIAVVIITIGSAKAKRAADAGTKFKTQLIYFGIALIVIFIAIPWPFSPLASRPLIRY
jgi:hypothetical protein